MGQRVRLQRDRYAPRPSSLDTRADGFQATPSPLPGPAPLHGAGFHFGAIDIASKEQVASMAADPLQRRTHLFVRPTKPRWEPGDALPLQRQIRVEPLAPLGGPVPVQRNGEGDFLREALWHRRKAVGALSPEEERRVQYEEFASAAGERETAEADAFQGTGSVRRRVGVLEHAEALAHTAGARETQEAAAFQGTGSVRRRAARLDYLENLVRTAGARETAEAGAIHPTPLDGGQVVGLESLVGLRVGRTELQSKRELTTRAETFSTQVAVGERLGVPLRVAGAGGTTPQHMAANLGTAIAGVGVTWELGGTQYNNADRNEGGGQVLRFSTNIRVPRRLTVKGTGYRLTDHVIANLLLPRDAEHAIKLEEVEKALETRGTGDPRWDGQQFQGSKLTVKVGGDGTIVTAFYDDRLWLNSRLPERYNNWLKEQQKAASTAKLKEVSAAWTDEVFERFRNAMKETNNQTRAAEKIGINSRRSEFYKAYRTWAATN